MPIPFRLGSSVRKRGIGQFASYCLEEFAIDQILGRIGGFTGNCQANMLIFSEVEWLKGSENAVFVADYAHYTD